MTSPTTTHTVAVGDIFVASWGYDQTNVDAYQVVATTRCTVKVRQIGMESESTGAMTAQVRPVRDSFEADAKVITKRPYTWVYDGKDETHLNMTYGSCSQWDGARTYYSSSYA